MEKQITRFLNNFKSKQPNGELENEYKPFICIQSSVDEGKHLTDIERKQHLYKELKKLRHQIGKNTKELNCQTFYMLTKEKLRLAFMETLFAQKNLKNGLNI